MPTKRNNNGAVAKVRVLVKLGDTIRHIKTFRVISNEMPVLLLMLMLFQLFGDVFSEKF